MAGRNLALYAPYVCLHCGHENHFQGDFFGYGGRVILIYVCAAGHETGIYSFPELDPYRDHHYRSLYDPLYPLFGQREVL